jgi:hypothetical protein
MTNHEHRLMIRVPLDDVLKVEDVRRSAERAPDQDRWPSGISPPCVGHDVAATSSGQRRVASTEHVCDAATLSCESLGERLRDHGDVACSAQFPIIPNHQMSECVNVST